MTSERAQQRIERLLDQADEAVNQLDWITARDRAQAVLDLDPENQDAPSLLAAAERALARSSTTSNEPAQPSAPSTLTPQPTSFADGRYQVSKLLGEGGKKRVYLAHDATLDRDVAFALIKTEGLDEASRTRVSREAQAMGRLGDHPNIVTVYDLGDENGQPYMVLPVLTGGDVEGLIEDAPDHRVPMEQALKIARETCLGLEFLHSKGIVHRDLKPGNVWLSADGTAKIGDFGLAIATDRSRLTQEGMMVGTASYMPPEQALGGEVTPQSDLYSLGAMLYELVTGRPPFLGDDSVAIISQHINTPPVAPTWHNAHCPKLLEALLLRLLAKDPAQRPSSAADVLSALNNIDFTEDMEVESDASDDAAHSLDTLAGGVFVGRQREMGELKAALEDALSGHGRLVTLAGEPGIGKTRTAEELATYAGLRQAQVLWGRCYEGAGVPPYWPWVQAIRTYVRNNETDRLRSEMGAGAADIAEIVSDVKERFPDLEPAPTFEADSARFRLFDSVTSFLKGASLSRPLVLILDDLQWADESSLLLLQFLARELAGSRLLVVGTYRDVDLSRQHPLADALGELTRERLFKRILLGGLTQHDVGRFIELTSGLKPPSGLPEAVYSETEGNPLFVTEVVRLLVQEGELTAERIKEGKSWNVRIPEGVREVIGRRLNRLSERCNQTLTIAAVIGREFELRQLRPLIEDASEDRLLELLEEALSARLIEELPQAIGRYQFTHALIQETLAAELSLTRKIRLHAQIAETLENLGGSEVDASGYAAELAYHFSEAQAVLGPDKLIKYSLLAGQRAMTSYAHEEALGHFQRALDAKGDKGTDAEAAAILFGLGRTQSALGHIEEVISSYTKAFNYYFDVKDVEKAVAIGASPLTAYAGRLEGALELCNRALEMVDKNSPDAGRLFSNQGLALGLQKADYEGSHQSFEKALAIARQRENKGLEMGTLATSTWVDTYHLRIADPLEKAARVEELAGEIDDPLSQATAHYSASIMQTFAGNSQSGLQHAHAALPLAEQVRDVTWLVRAHFGVGLAHTATGDWGLAGESADRASAVLPNYPVITWLSMIRALQTGNIEGGKLYLDRMEESITHMPPGPTLWHGNAALGAAQVSGITGDARGARLAHEAASIVLSSKSATPLISWMANVALALLAVQRGDVKQASELYPSVQALPRIWCFVYSPHVLGLLARTMGKLGESEGHFEDALVFCRKAAYRPELGWACFNYAEMLLERDDPGDRQKAQVLLAESLQIASDLGMPPLLERVLSKRDILKA